MRWWFTDELEKQRLLWFPLKKLWDIPKLVSACLWRGIRATVPLERIIKTSDRRATHAQSAKKNFE